MTIKIIEVDDMGRHLLNCFLENDGTVIFNEDIYFKQLDHFQQIEILEGIKEQFNNAVDNIKRSYRND